MILNELAGYSEPVTQNKVVAKQRAKLVALAKKKRKTISHDDIKAKSMKSLTSMLGGLKFR